MASALQSLLSQIGLAVAPLRSVQTPAQGQALLHKLGYEVPVGAFASALTTLAARAGDLTGAVRALADATNDDDVAVALADLFVRLVAVVEAIGQLRDELQGGGGAIPDIDRLPARLTDFLLLEFFESQRASFHAALHVLGLIENVPDPVPGQPMRTVNWSRLTLLISDPARIFDEVYRWKTDFDTDLFLVRLEKMLRAMGLPGGIYPQSDAAQAALGNATAKLKELRFPMLQKGLTEQTYTQFGVTLSPAEAQAGKLKGVALMPYLLGATAFDFAVCDRGELLFKSTADIRGIGIVVRPPFTAEGLLNLTAALDASLTIREKPSKSEEMILLGASGGTRLAIQGLGIKWFAAGTPDKLDVGFEGELQAIRLVIAPGDGDGFIQKILSGINVRAEATVAFGFALQSGFTFRGGARLGIELGTHIDLGPVRIDALRFALAPSSDQLGLDAGVVLKLALGPLKAVVEDIGVTTALRFQPGNLGGADLSIGFKPPTGVGLSLDAGGFKGGGFLRIDKARGEYAGALELDFQGMFSVKAIGVITTKLPDGSPGFSLLILISAEFTPIQLSFGFTLNGVGGIIGLNRCISVSALAEGIRTNAVTSILFPEDLVGSFDRILSDIRQFFPTRDGHFVVGPMAKLGWGTPTIITIELGLLLDLPDPILAIVGVLKAVLPSEDAPILRLQVNFLGILDFGHGYIFFRADLFDSRLLVYTITGTMAFLVSWGEAQTFALSVGGFHPDFHDVPTIPALPDAFASMARIGISLLSDDNPRLKIESYFAVTSNTVQFGARAELYASAAGFNIYGFLGYDVLFQFEPFRFIAKLEGGVALRRGTSVIAAIHVSAALAGPTPWDARGEASLEFLFFEISIPFHATWGDPPAAIESATEDLLQLLLREFADTRNWRADLPPANHLYVSLRKLEAGAAEALVVHPAGVLTFSQRSMPLEDFVIQKFGTKKPLAENKFKISAANSNGTPLPADTQGVRELFAPGQFLDLSDSEKLSRRSFAELPSGFQLAATSDLLTGPPVVRPVIYELSYLRRKQLQLKGLVTLVIRAYDRLVKGSSVRQSSLSFQQSRVSVNAPPAVVLPAESFVVAGVSDLKAYGGDGGSVAFSSEAEAYQRRAAILAQNPALAGKLQVVSSYELNAN